MSEGFNLNTATSQLNEVGHTFTTTLYQFVFLNYTLENIF